MLRFANAAVTVKAVAPAVSSTSDGATDRWTAGSRSLSVRVTRVPSTVRSENVPETEIVSLSSTSVSSVGVSVNVPVALVCPEGMGMSKSATDA